MPAASAPDPPQPGKARMLDAESQCVGLKYVEEHYPILWPTCENFKVKNNFKNEAVNTCSQKGPLKCGTSIGTKLLSLSLLSFSHQDFCILVQSPEYQHMHCPLSPGPESPELL